MTLIQKADTMLKAPTEKDPDRGKKQGERLLLKSCCTNDEIWGKIQDLDVYCLDGNDSSFYVALISVKKNIYGDTWEEWVFLLTDQALVLGHHCEQWDMWGSQYFLFFSVFDSVCGKCDIESVNKTKPVDVFDFYLMFSFVSVNFMKWYLSIYQSINGLDCQSINALFGKKERINNHFYLK